MPFLDPSQWERTLTLKNGSRVFVRPIRRGDESKIQALLTHVNAQDLRLRFFGTIKVFSEKFVASLTQLDYVSAMAFVAFEETEANILGVVRLHLDPAGRNGEYAVLVQSDIKGEGLGWAMMQLIIEYARSTNLASITGQVLTENRLMLDMCRELGFLIKRNIDERGVSDVRLALGT
jgi:acetyltransferase